MKKILLTNIIALFCSAFALNAQNLILFNLNDLEGWNISKNVGFISLSDLYARTDTNALFVIPDRSKITNEEIQYFELNSEYRKKFLSQTPFSETDTTFIYDYATNVLTSFRVKDLKIVACLNPYMRPDDCYNRNFPCTDDDYMIGFEIDKNYLNGFSPYYCNTLVYVGKESPFVRGELKPVIWEKTNVNDCPKTDILDNTVPDYVNIYSKDDVYVYKTDEFHFFIQNLKYRWNCDDNVTIDARHLIVVDVKSGAVLVDRVVGLGEGKTPVPLNFVSEDSDDVTTFQWMGYLFKNEPQVLFEFEYSSFDCMCIIVLGVGKEDICISCDNRH